MRRRQSFTLVELLVTVLIIGIRVILAADWRSTVNCPTGGKDAQGEAQAVTVPRDGSDWVRSASTLLGNDSFWA